MKDESFAKQKGALKSSMNESQKKVTCRIIIILGHGIIFACIAMDYSLFRREV